MGDCLEGVFGDWIARAKFLGFLTTKWNGRAVNQSIEEEKEWKCAASSWQTCR